MAWIEDALKVSDDLDVDDLFLFDNNGFVTSKWDSSRFEFIENEITETDPPGIFIHNDNCNHEFGAKCGYDSWKRKMMDEYEANHDKPLDEEAFFRDEEHIPGGADLIERTRKRKQDRATKYHRSHYFSRDP